MTFLLDRRRHARQAETALRQVFAAIPHSIESTPAKVAPSAGGGGD
jgi:hypothetical protein